MALHPVGFDHNGEYRTEEPVASLGGQVKCEAMTYLPYFVPPSVSTA
jgi:hypothetical protein